MDEQQLNYDAILDDLAFFYEVRDHVDPDDVYWLYEEEAVTAHTDMVEDADGLPVFGAKVDRAAVQREMEALHEKEARGKAYYQQNYRVGASARHIEGYAGGDGHDVPADALAFRRVWSGYLATSPTFRWQYLTQADARDLISLSAAARLLRGGNTTADLVYVRALIRDGKLHEYTDASVRNPQHRRRVRRSEVEAHQRTKLAEL